MFQNLMKGVAWINMFWGEFVSDDNIGSNELRRKTEFAQYFEGVITSIGAQVTWIVCFWKRSTLTH